MSKIYQKMYLRNKNRSKSVLDRFIHNVILKCCYSESRPLYFKRAGFTLIELLVVVLIIGILAAVALPQYQTAVLKSRFMSFMPTVRALINAQEVYYLANGQYAFDMGLLDVQIPADCHVRSDNSAPNEILCGTDWLLDNTSGNNTAYGHMKISYCPGKNDTGSNSCPQAADAVLYFYYAQQAEKGGQFECVSHSKQGTLLCNTFEGIF